MYFLQINWGWDRGLQMNTNTMRIHKLPIFRKTLLPNEWYLNCSWENLHEILDYWGCILEPVEPLWLCSLSGGCAPSIFLTPDTGSSLFFNGSIPHPFSIRSFYALLHVSFVRQFKYHLLCNNVLLNGQVSLLLQIARHATFRIASTLMF